MQESWSGCHFHLQGNLLTQGSNPRLLCLLRWRQILDPLSHCKIKVLSWFLGIHEEYTVAYICRLRLQLRRQELITLEDRAQCSAWHMTHFSKKVMVHKQHFKMKTTVPKAIKKRFINHLSFTLTY